MTIRLVSPALLISLLFACTTEPCAVGHFVYGFVSGTSCDAETPTGKTPPTIDAGGNFTIPQSTPFELTPVSSGDANGDTLTYSWEELDLGVQQDVNAGDNGSSPLFRFWPPSLNPTRVIPRITDLLNNTTVRPNECDHRDHVPEEEQIDIGVLGRVLQGPDRCIWIGVELSKSVHELIETEIGVSIASRKEHRIVRLNRVDKAIVSP